MLSCSAREIYHLWTCLWHLFARPTSVVLEDEAHVLCSCPCYANARQVCFQQLGAEHLHRIALAADDSRAACLFTSHHPQDWIVLGDYVARVRQIRRKARQRFSKLAEKLEQRDFAKRRTAWRAKGFVVCRHGIFFRCTAMPQCPCISAAEEQEWQHAKYMPQLCEELKTIVAAPFQLGLQTRLAVLQAEMRRRCW